MKHGPGSTPRLTCCPDAGLGAPLAPRLPETATAVAEHAIGAADVAVIRSVLARIPARIGTQQRAQVEADLVRHAGCWMPGSWRCWASGCWPTSTKTAGHPTIIPPGDT
ncbi:MAG TPA: DUF222 domain-containing protein [Pseudonocardiaceae bacterium]|nr:DUF222 domain-containing protein [Pseudonocardiaceae bacterium]